MNVKKPSNSSNKLCVLCLCVGRSLNVVPEDKILKYYVDSLREIPLHRVSSVLPVCWECEILLKRAVQLREQVQDSHRILQTNTKEYINKHLPTEVSRKSCLKTTKNEPIAISPKLNCSRRSNARVRFKDEAENEGKTKNRRESSTTNPPDVIQEFISSVDHQQQDNLANVKSVPKRKPQRRAQKKSKTKSKISLDKEKFTECFLNEVPHETSDICNPTDVQIVFMQNEDINENSTECFLSEVPHETSDICNPTNVQIVSVQDENINENSTECFLNEVPHETSDICNPTNVQIVSLQNEDINENPTECFLNEVPHKTSDICNPTNLQIVFVQNEDINGNSTECFLNEVPHETSDICNPTDVQIVFMQNEDINENSTECFLSEVPHETSDICNPTNVQIVSVQDENINENSTECFLNEVTHETSDICNPMNPQIVFVQNEDINGNSTECFLNEVPHETSDICNPTDVQIVFMQNEDINENSTECFLSEVPHEMSDICNPTNVEIVFVQNEDINENSTECFLNEVLHEMSDICNPTNVEIVFAQAEDINENSGRVNQDLISSVDHQQQDAVVNAKSVFREKFQRWSPKKLKTKSKISLDKEKFTTCFVDDLPRATSDICNPTNAHSVFVQDEDKNENSGRVNQDLISSVDHQQQDALVNVRSVPKRNSQHRSPKKLKTNSMKSLDKNKFTACFISDLPCVVTRRIKKRKNLQRAFVQVDDKNENSGRDIQISDDCVIDANYADDSAEKMGWKEKKNGVRDKLSESKGDIETAFEDDDLNEYLQTEVSSPPSLKISNNKPTAISSNADCSGTPNASVDLKDKAKNEVNQDLISSVDHQQQDALVNVRSVPKRNSQHRSPKKLKTNSIISLDKNKFTACLVNELPRAKSDISKPKNLQSAFVQDEDKNEDSGRDIQISDDCVDADFADDFVEKNGFSGSKEDIETAFEDDDLNEYLQTEVSSPPSLKISNNKPTAISSNADCSGSPNASVDLKDKAKNEVNQDLISSVDHQQQDALVNARSVPKRNSQHRSPKKLKTNSIISLDKNKFTSCLVNELPRAKSDISKPKNLQSAFVQDEDKNEDSGRDIQISDDCVDADFADDFVEKNGFSGSKEDIETAFEDDDLNEYLQTEVSSPPRSKITNNKPTAISSNADCSGSPKASVDLKDIAKNEVNQDLISSVDHQQQDALVNARSVPKRNSQHRSPKKLKTNSKINLDKNKFTAYFIGDLPCVTRRIKKRKNLQRAFVQDDDKNENSGRDIQISDDCVIDADYADDSAEKMGWKEKKNSVPNKFSGRNGDIETAFEDDDLNEYLQTEVSSPPSLKISNNKPTAISSNADCSGSPNASVDLKDKAKNEVNQDLISSVDHQQQDALVNARSVPKRNSQHRSPKKLKTNSIISLDKNKFTSCLVNELPRAKSDISKPKNLQSAFVQDEDKNEDSGRGEYSDDIQISDDCVDADFADDFVEENGFSGSKEDIETAFEDDDLNEYLQTEVSSPPRLKISNNKPTAISSNADCSGSPNASVDLKDIAKNEVNQDLTSSVDHQQQDALVNARSVPKRNSQHRSPKKLKTNSMKTLDKNKFTAYFIGDLPCVTRRIKKRKNLQRAFVQDDDKNENSGRDIQISDDCVIDADYADDSAEKMGWKEKKNSVPDKFSGRNGDIETAFEDDDLNEYLQTEVSSPPSLKISNNKPTAISSNADCFGSPNASVDLKDKAKNEVKQDLISSVDHQQQDALVNARSVPKRNSQHRSPKKLKTNSIISLDKNKFTSCLVNELPRAKSDISKPKNLQSAFVQDEDKNEDSGRDIQISDDCVDADFADDFVEKNGFSGSKEDIETAFEDDDLNEYLQTEVSSPPRSKITNNKPTAISSNADCSGSPKASVDLKDIAKNEVNQDLTSSVDHQQQDALVNARSVPKRNSQHRSPKKLKTNSMKSLDKNKFTVYFIGDLPCVTRRIKKRKNLQRAFAQDDDKNENSGRDIQISDDCVIDADYADDSAEKMGWKEKKNGVRDKLSESKGDIETAFEDDDLNEYLQTEVSSPPSLKISNNKPTAISSNADCSGSPNASVDLKDKAKNEVNRDLISSVDHQQQDALVNARSVPKRNSQHRSPKKLKTNSMKSLDKNKFTSCLVNDLPRAKSDISKPKNLQSAFVQDEDKNEDSGRGEYSDDIQISDDCVKDADFADEFLAKIGLTRKKNSVRDKFSGSKGNIETAFKDNTEVSSPPRLKITNNKPTAISSNADCSGSPNVSVDLKDKTKNEVKQAFISTVDHQQQHTLVNVRSVPRKRQSRYCSPEKLKKNKERNKRNKIALTKQKFTLCFINELPRATSDIKKPSKLQSGLVQDEDKNENSGRDIQMSDDCVMDPDFSDDSGEEMGFNPIPSEKKSSDKFRGSKGDNETAFKDNNLNEHLQTEVSSPPRLKITSNKPTAISSNVDCSGSSNVSVDLKDNEVNQDLSSSVDHQQQDALVNVRRVPKKKSQHSSPKKLKTNSMKSLDKNKFTLCFINELPRATSDIKKPSKPQSGLVQDEDKNENSGRDIQMSDDCVMDPDFSDDSGEEMGFNPIPSEKKSSDKFRGSKGDNETAFKDNNLNEYLQTKVSRLSHLKITKNMSIAIPPRNSRISLNEKKFTVCYITDLPRATSDFSKPTNTEIMFVQHEYKNENSDRDIRISDDCVIDADFIDDSAENLGSKFWGFQGDIETAFEDDAEVSRLSRLEISQNEYIEILPNVDCSGSPNVSADLKDKANNEVIEDFIGSVEQEREEDTLVYVKSAAANGNRWTQKIIKRNSKISLDKKKFTECFLNGVPHAMTDLHSVFVKEEFKIEKSDSDIQMSDECPMDADFAVDVAEKNGLSESEGDSETANEDDIFTGCLLNEVPYTTSDICNQTDLDLELFVKDEVKSEHSDSDNDISDECPIDADLAFDVAEKNGLSESEGDIETAFEDDKIQNMDDEGDMTLKVKLEENEDLQSDCLEEENDREWMRVEADSDPGTVEHEHPPARVPGALKRKAKRCPAKKTKKAKRVQRKRREQKEAEADPGTVEQEHPPTRVRGVLKRKAKRCPAKKTKRAKRVQRKLS
uniref:ZAD domain-containing protein n=1 Tax=Bombyx mori TaxID=7091 RepID=A0A8R2QVI0_BOMMO|nr:uncharacterized protein LOC101738426 isoform X2 [Bombyx mori]